MMRIGEAAAAARMTTKALRFYEDRGLLPRTDRAANGYRDYDAEIIVRLKFIRRGRAAGLSLAQISGILAVHDRGTAPCTHVRDALAGQPADLDNQIAGLTALRTTIAAFHDAAAAGDPAACDPDRICSYL
jgi:MerR family copper efflux transcriptional regulator